MTNKDIIEALSSIENELFYRYAGGLNKQGVNYSDLQSMHSMIKASLIKWHELTGEIVD